MHKQTDKLSTDEDLYDVNTARPQWSELKNSDPNLVQNDQRFLALITFLLIWLICLLNYFLKSSL